MSLPDWKIFLGLSSGLHLSIVFLWVPRSANTVPHPPPPYVMVTVDAQVVSLQIKCIRSMDDSVEGHIAG